MRRVYVLLIVGLISVVLQGCASPDASPVRTSTGNTTPTRDGSTSSLSTVTVKDNDVEQLQARIAALDREVASIKSELASSREREAAIVERMSSLQEKLVEYLELKKKSELPEPVKKSREEPYPAEGGAQHALEPYPAATEAATKSPQRIRVSSNIQAEKLIRQSAPVYLPLTNLARVRGTVRFQAIIGTDGSIKSLQLMDGDPSLVSSATEAVKRWVYQPTLLNGEPVEVVTQIKVNVTPHQ